MSFRALSVVHVSKTLVLTKAEMLSEIIRTSNNISGTSILTSEIFQKPTTHLNVSSSSNSDFPKVLINF